MAPAFLSHGSEEGHLSPFSNFVSLCLFVGQTQLRVCGDATEWGGTGEQNSLRADDNMLCYCTRSESFSAIFDKSKTVSQGKLWSRVRSPGMSELNAVKAFGNQE